MNLRSNLNKNQLFKWKIWENLNLKKFYSKAWHAIIMLLQLIKINIIIKNFYLFNKYLLIQEPIRYGNKTELGILDFLKGYNVNYKELRKV